MRLVLASAWMRFRSARRLSRTTRQDDQCGVPTDPNREPTAATPGVTYRDVGWLESTGVAVKTAASSQTASWDSRSDTHASSCASTPHHGPKQQPTSTSAEPTHQTQLPLAIALLVCLLAATTTILNSLDTRTPLAANTTTNAAGPMHSPDRSRSPRAPRGTSAAPRPPPRHDRSRPSCTSQLFRHPHVPTPPRHSPSPRDPEARQRAGSPFAHDATETRSCTSPCSLCIACTRRAQRRHISTVRKIRVGDTSHAPRACHWRTGFLSHHPATQVSFAWGIGTSPCAGRVP